MGELHACIDCGTTWGLAHERCAVCWRKRTKEVEAAAKAYRDLCTCYRLGRNPSEALWTKIEKAKKVIR